MTTVCTLRKAAEALRVHPRTVMRRLTGDLQVRRSQSWGHADVYRVSVEQVAIVFDMDIRVLERTLAGRDELMTVREIAEYLRVPVGTFMYRQYPVAVYSHRLVRHSRRDTALAHAEWYA